MQALTALSDIISYIDAKSDFHAIQTDKIIKVNFNKTDKIISNTDTDNKEETTDMQYDHISPRRRKDGRWEYRKVINGERLSFYGYTQKECIESYKQFIGKGKSGKSYKLYDYIDAYIKKTKGSTYEEVERVARLHIKPNIRNRDIRNIRENDIENLLNKIETSRNKQKAYDALYHVFELACKRKAMTLNVLNEVDRPTYKKKKGSALTAREEKILLEKIIGNRYENIIKFLLYTGVRRGEAFNLTYNDVDFDANTIHIRGTKTETSDRFIPIFPDVRPLLDDNGKGLLFDIPRHKEGITRYFKSILQNHKLHDLRHTFATRAIQRGVPMRIVQAWLGHSDFTTTANIYSHVVDTTSQDWAKKMT